ncbi:nuclear transport factor 2 family protein [Rhodanobacter umsongensis]
MKRKIDNTQRRIPEWLVASHDIWREDRVRPSSYLFALLFSLIMALPMTAFANGTSTQADENRKTVVAFYEQFFNQHDLTAADRYIGDTYIQHNPNVPNGRKAFVDAFTKVFAQFPRRHSRIVRVIAEGDLVVLHVDLTKSADDRDSAVVDIFRLEHGRIVEHWDVQQAIPEKAANDSTMF